MEEIDLIATTDASIWAAQFMDLVDTDNIDEETMLGWFANAIEVGRSEGYTTMRKHILNALNELGVPDEAYPAPVANAGVILRDALRIG